MSTDRTSQHGSSALNQPRHTCERNVAT